MNNFRARGHGWRGWALATAILFLPLAKPAGEALANPMDARGERWSQQGPHSRYNFPRASRGDRFAPKGLVTREGIKGWARYGSLIKDCAKQQGVDPYVVGAYIWLESGFDPKQDYANDTHHAIGLGSIQPGDYQYRYSEKQLMDPWLNAMLTAHEFKLNWHPHDIAGTVMDVWYPSWRKRAAQGQALPVVQAPEVYVQAIANRYYALREIDEHLVPKRMAPKPRPRKRPAPEPTPRLIGAA